ncbi:hypothetical protein BYT27DRAFT_7261630 [Phlegmacium glaucopus]|nr:hypothetical protein BYT27DRAFT_7261630 [Phlegmacium glaucopus]
MQVSKSTMASIFVLFQTVWVFDLFSLSPASILVLFLDFQHPFLVSCGSSRSSAALFNVGLHIVLSSNCLPFFLSPVGLLAPQPPFSPPI